MTIEELVNQIGLWVGAAGGLFGIFGILVAVFQWAIIRERKRELVEAQFLIAGINSTALQQQQAWTNQIALYQKPETQSEFELYQFLVRARDDAALIAQLAVTMESAINAETSAIHENSRKSIEYQKLTNKLQEETLKKPSLQVVSG